MKICFKCGAKLPLSEFYVHKMMGDGHLGKCKACTKRDVMEHRQANRAKVNAYDRMRAKWPDRIELSKRLTKRYKERHPGRFNVNQQARRAIKRGILTPKPCEFCGERKVVAHHDDYSKPLAVRWMCHSCHRRYHSGTLPKQRRRLTDAL